MSKFKKGDKVRAFKGFYEGATGVVTDPWWQISQSDWPKVEFLGPDGKFVLADEDDLEPTEDPYEYAVQRVYGTTPRTIHWDEWTTKLSAERCKGPGGADPVWGAYIEKVVKRRKAGPIEDAT